MTFKRLLVLCNILILLTSCDPSKRAIRHYNKAVKFGLKVVQDSDTIRITSVDSVAVIQNDTIIWEKVITTKDTIINFKNVYVPKTRWQTRIEYRYKTKILKQEVLKYKYIYKAEKKQKSKTNWMLLVWGFIAGVFLSFVTRLLLKIYL
jgi:hypothetical protein